MLQQHLARLTLRRPAPNRIPPGLTRPALRPPPAIRRAATRCAPSRLPGPSHPEGNRKGYSTVVEAPAGTERVFVKCRSNGGLTLDILRPAVSRRDGEVAPVILYLPSGPVVTADEAAVVAALSASSNCVVVKINYRLGGPYQYPAPIHDVLAGYDYVKQRFSLADRDGRPGTTWTGRFGRKHVRFGVCGQLIGGSLASMLALTELKVGEDGVAAAALNCAITDWVFPEDAGDAELGSPMAEPGIMDGDLTDASPQSLPSTTAQPKPPPKSRAAKSSSWDAHGADPFLTTASLLRTRARLFRTPAHYFDPFASPIHFLRSPGADVPLPPPNQAETTLRIRENQVKSPKRRRTPRTFPPSNSPLLLPCFRVSAGEASPLFDMSREMVARLRRGVVRRGREREGHGFGGLGGSAGSEGLGGSGGRDGAGGFEGHSGGDERALREAERRIEWHVCAGTGLWGVGVGVGVGADGLGSWRSQVESVGAWFGSALGP